LTRNWSSELDVRYRGIPVDARTTRQSSVSSEQKLVIFPGGDGGVHAFQARTGKKSGPSSSKHGMNSSCLIDGDIVYATWDLDNYDSNKLAASSRSTGESRERLAESHLEKGRHRRRFPSATLGDARSIAYGQRATLRVRC